MSLLFFAGDFVYKVKKPVNLGYLDYSSLAERRRLCHREVELNSRLCPGTYLGVAPIVRERSGVRVEGEGEAVEYAVKMRRLPQERMLDRLIEEGRASAGTMRAIAARLAGFHRAAETSEEIAAYGSIDAVRYNAEENFTQTVPNVGKTVTPGTHEVLRRFTDDFLAANADLFGQRVSEGRIRDCHGDLHAAHICMTNAVCIYDCVEFNDRFRYGDVASEVAFLAMDLDRYRRNDLSRAFVDAYVDISRDSDTEALLPFYACYRAVVRGKVEGFKLGDGMIPEEERRAAQWLARTYFELARRYAEGRGLLVLMSGVTGSGKSAVAGRLGTLLAGSVLSSDVVRKELAGLPPEQHVWESFGRGLYSPEWTALTYDELFTRAAPVLSAGGCAILDATFLHAAERARALETARTASSRVMMIECVAPRKTLLQRLETRNAAGTVSDGRPEILDAQLADRDPPGEFPSGDHMTLDTTRDIETLMEEIWARF